MEQLIRILSQLRPDIDFMNNNSLIDDAIIDSFDIVAIIGQINEDYDVEITVEDILPENFNSAENMFKLIKRIQESN